MRFQLLSASESSLWELLVRSGKWSACATTINLGTRRPLTLKEISTADGCNHKKPALERGQDPLLSQPTCDW